MRVAFHNFLIYRKRPGSSNQSTTSNNLPSPSPCFDDISVEGCVGEAEILRMTAHESGEDSLPLKAVLVIVDVTVHEAVTEG